MVVLLMSVLDPEQLLDLVNRQTGSTPPNGIGRNARSNGIGTLTCSNYGSKPPKGRNAVNPGIGRDAATSQKME